MRVLITGATGFVGGRLAHRYVRSGDEVTAVVRTPSPGLAEIGVLQLDGGFDAIDEDLFDGVDLVVHAAAAAGPDLQQARRVNRDGTARMVETALSVGVERFVHISTTSVYDRSRGGDGAIDEDAPLVGDEHGPHGAGAYAITKAEAEHELAGAIDRGLPAVILRPPAILGAAPSSTWGTRIPRRILQGGSLPMHPDTTFGWVHIDDLVDVVVAAGASTDVFTANVVGGHVPFGEYLDAIMAILPDPPGETAPPDGPPWRGRYATGRVPIILGTPIERRFDDAMDEIADSWRAGDPDASTTAAGGDA